MTALAGWNDILIVLDVRCHLRLFEADAPQHCHVSADERFQSSPAADGDRPGHAQSAPGAFQAVCSQRTGWTHGDQGHDAVHGCAEILGH